MGVGTAVLMYSRQLVDNFGRMYWVESKLGSGSTYGVVKLLALLAIVYGGLHLTGLADEVFTPLLSPLRNLFQR